MSLRCSQHNQKALIPSKLVQAGIKYISRNTHRSSSVIERREIVRDSCQAQHASLLRSSTRFIKLPIIPYIPGFDMSSVIDTCLSWIGLQRIALDSATAPSVMSTIATNTRQQISSPTKTGALLYKWLWNGQYSIFPWIPKPGKYPLQYPTYRRIINAQFVLVKYLVLLLLLFNAKSWPFVWHGESVTDQRGKRKFSDAPLSVQSSFGGPRSELTSRLDVKDSRSITGP
jgi:hypothetical protein